MITEGPRGEAGSSEYPGGGGQVVWLCSSGSSERDRPRATPPPPRSRWRSGKHGVKAVEPSERLFDGHLRNCARFQATPLSQLERRWNRRRMCRRRRRPERRVRDVS